VSHGPLYRMEGFAHFKRFSVRYYSYPQNSAISVLWPPVRSVLRVEKFPCHFKRHIIVGGRNEDVQYRNLGAIGAGNYRGEGKRHR
jgi:hypothetical protein